jgi:hypothetical protein
MSNTKGKNVRTSKVPRLEEVGERQMVKQQITSPFRVYFRNLQHKNLLLGFKHTVSSQQLRNHKMADVLVGPVGEMRSYASE